jgi:hypothetical protein
MREVRHSRPVEKWLARRSQESPSVQSVAVAVSVSLISWQTNAVCGSMRHSFKVRCSTT